MSCPRPRLRLLAFGLACLAATASLAAEAVFPPGSRIGIVPPKDMELSKRFSGFEGPGAAAITFVEMPAEASPDILAGLTPETLAAEGVVLKNRETVQVAGSDATLVTGELPGQGGALRKWILVASDPTLTAVVIAQAAETAGALSEADMRGALTSVALRPPLPIEDQVAALPFRLGERAGFRPVRTTGGNSLLLTDGASDVIRNMEQPIIILAQSTAPGPSVEQRDAFAKSALAANGMLKEFAVERSQGFRQNGADWHEIVARATDAASGEPVVVMQTIRFGQGNLLRMVGITRLAAREAMLPRFRSLIDAVESR